MAGHQIIGLGGLIPESELGHVELDFPRIRADQSGDYSLSAIEHDSLFPRLMSGSSEGILAGHQVRRPLFFFPGRVDVLLREPGSSIRLEDLAGQLLADASLQAQKELIEVVGGAEGTRWFKGLQRYLEV